MRSIGAVTRRFALPEWPWYLGGIVALAITNILTLEIPQLAKHIVNHVDSATQSELSRTALAIIGLGALLIFIRSFSRILIFWPGRKLETTIKSHLFSRLLASKMQFFQSHSMGDLISRLANDVTHVRVFFAFGFLQLLNLIFLVLFTCQQMLSVNAILTVTALTPLLLMIGVIALAMPRMHRYSRLNQEALGRLTNRVTESFVNVHVLQSNVANHAFMKRSDVENTYVYDTNMKLLFIRQVMFPMMSFLSNISQIAVLFYGGYLVIDKAITVGDIMAFNVYIGYLTFPLSAMGIIIAIYLRTKTAIERLNAIDESQAEQGEDTFSEEEGQTSPELELKSLNFKYLESQEQQDHQTNFAIENISLALRKHKKIGLCGPIGSGKSTLMSIISRIHDPAEGSVFIQGKDITHIRPTDLRKQIGYAQQTVHLFSDTIKNNLQFGLDHAPTQEQLNHAASLACILDEILSLPDGWDTEIGERGVRLSGGQKQRLALARIFLRKPNIVMLDDVLSAVDQGTERRLLRAIDEEFSCALIASHRASALKQCDEVLIINNGRCMDRGIFSEIQARHPELLGEDHHEPS